jgi:metallo-beta-lactamase family protein
LAEVINSTAEAGGNIVIPAFAVERSQELLYYLNELLKRNEIPHLMVMLDSPMAVSVTEVFRNHKELFNGHVTEMTPHGASPFSFPGLKLVSSVEESKAINHIKGTVIIIAGAGMCNGGRIKHHLVTNISRPESTILFVGYQAMGTLGRLIVDGVPRVRILGQEYPVRARIARINGFSGHADRDELLRWLSGLKTPPKRLFVVHGEPETAHEFADLIKERFNWEVSVPKFKEEVILD